MTIRVLQSDVRRVGPVSVNLIEVTDPGSGDKTVDYDVQCDVCERYACTHLKEREAFDELERHVAGEHPTVAKSLVLVNTTVGELRRNDLVLRDDEVVLALRTRPDGNLIVEYIGGTTSEPLASNTPVEVMREKDSK